VISFAVCVAFVNTDDLLRAKMYAQFAAFTFFRVYDNFENRSQSFPFRMQQQ
jgi:hypothetical protein